jgi:hypothetical protein
MRPRKTVRGPDNAPLTNLRFSGAALQRELPCNQQRPDQLNDHGLCKERSGLLSYVEGKGLVQAGARKVNSGEVAELAAAGARAYVIHWFVSRTARHLPSTFSSTTVAPE